MLGDVLLLLDEITHEFARELRTGTSVRDIEGIAERVTFPLPKALA